MIHHRRTHTVFVFNYLIYIIILWGERVEYANGNCYLSIGLLLLPPRSLPRLGMWGYCSNKLSASKLLTIRSFSP